MEGGHIASTNNPHRTRKQNRKRPARATCPDSNTESNTKLRKQCPEENNDILKKQTNVVTINSPQRTSDPSFCSKTQLNEMKHSQTLMSTTFFLDFILQFFFAMQCMACIKTIYLSQEKVNISVLSHVFPIFE